MNAQLKPTQDITTTTHAVRVYRDYEKKLIAETSIMLNDTKRLIISTRKNSRGYLETDASVMNKTDGDGWTHTFSFGSSADDDFRLSKIAISKPGRVTEKVILAQHNAINFDDVIAKAKAFYHIA